MIYIRTNDWKKNGVFLENQFSDLPVSYRMSINDYCRTMMLLKSIIYALGHGFKLRADFRNINRPPRQLHDSENNTTIFVVTNENLSFAPLRDFQITSKGINEFLNLHRDRIFSEIPSPGVRVPMCPKPSIFEQIFRVTSVQDKFLA